MKVHVMIVVVVLMSTQAKGANDPPLTWTNTDARMPVGVQTNAVVYDDANGAIYSIGGWTGTRYNDQIFKYTISDGVVGVHGQFIGVYAGSAVLADQHIYYLAGYNDQYTANITTYSTHTGEYSQVNSFPVGMGYMGSASTWDHGNRVVYIFGGSNGTSMDTIFKYNVTSNELRQVGQLPGGGRYGTTTAVATINSTVYIFGGDGGSGSSYRDIFEFNPVTGTTAKLAAVLPRPVQHGCAVFADSNVYIQHFTGLIRFHPESGRVEEVEVDRGSWPEYLYGAACVYVEELRRIYVLGGYGHFNGGTIRDMDEVSYFDLLI